MNIEGRNPVEMVNINTASAEELSERLVGVDPAQAQRIVEYRQEHGPFSTVEALLEVPDVGAVVLELNAVRLTVESIPGAADLGTGDPSRDKSPDQP